MVLSVKTCYSAVLLHKRMAEASFRMDRALWTRVHGWQAWASWRMDVQGHADHDDTTAGNRRIVVALLWKADTGTVTSVNDLAAELDRDRFEVIFVFWGPHGAACGRLEQLHRVFCLPQRRRGGGGRISSLRQLVDILRTQHVDVLHCHNPRANLFGVLAGAIARTPAVLVQVHGLRRTRTFLRKLANTLIFRKASRIIAVAEAVKTDILRTNWRVPPEKLIVLENSVDCERFSRAAVSRAGARESLGLSDGAFVFGAVARLGPFKGHSFLLGAFHAVRNECPSAVLLIVGEGPQKAKLQSQAERLGLGASVRFLGYRADVPELFAAMDAFVLPSIDSEGMPRVILEAMAAGVPCIGTTIGGTPEVLDQGRLGVLVPPRDVQGLARAMLEVVAWPQPKRQGLIEQASRRVRTRYAHDVLRAKLAELYEREFAASQNHRGDD